MSTLTRRPNHDDIPALRLIWKTAFGDGDLDGFFNHYYARDHCIVAVTNDTPVSAGYLLPAGSYLDCDGPGVPCAMIYGVATLPGFRGQGFGAAVVRGLIAEGHDSGYAAITLCPAEDSLFNYYSARTDLRDWFYIHERRHSYDPASNINAGLIPVAAGEYDSLRSNFLAGVPHIAPDIRALTYQALLCRQYGGGFYSIDTKNGAACAVVERQSPDVVWIKELLSPAECENDALAAIMSSYPAKEYIVRTPARSSPHSGQGSGNIDPSVRRFGMISTASTLHSQSAPPWLGLAFD